MIPSRRRSNEEVDEVDDDDAIEEIDDNEDSEEPDNSKDSEDIDDDLHESGRTHQQTSQRDQEASRSGSKTDDEQNQQQQQVQLLTTGDIARTGAESSEERNQLITISSAPLQAPFRSGESYHLREDGLLAGTVSGSFTRKNLNRMEQRMILVDPNGTSLFDSSGHIKTIPIQLQQTSLTVDIFSDLKNGGVSELIKEPIVPQYKTVRTRLKTVLPPSTTTKQRAPQKQAETHAEEVHNDIPDSYNLLVDIGEVMFTESLRGTYEHVLANRLISVFEIYLKEKRLNLMEFLRKRVQRLRKEFANIFGSAPRDPNVPQYSELAGLSTESRQQLKVLISDCHATRVQMLNQEVKEYNILQQIREIWESILKTRYHQGFGATQLEVTLEEEGSERVKEEDRRIEAEIDEEVEERKWASWEELQTNREAHGMKVAQRKKNKKEVSEDEDEEEVVEGDDDEDDESENDEPDEFDKDEVRASIEDNRKGLAIRAPGEPLITPVISFMSETEMMGKVEAMLRRGEEPTAEDYAMEDEVEEEIEDDGMEYQQMPQIGHDSIHAKVMNETHKYAKTVQTASAFKIRLLVNGHVVFKSPPKQMKQGASHLYIPFDEHAFVNVLRRPNSISVELIRCSTTADPGTKTGGGLETVIAVSNPVMPGENAHITTAPVLSFLEFTSKKPYKPTWISSSVHSQLVDRGTKNPELNVQRDHLTAPLMEQDYYAPRSERGWVKCILAWESGHQPPASAMPNKLRDTTAVDQTSGDEHDDDLDETGDVKETKKKQPTMQDPNLITVRQSPASALFGIHPEVLQDNFYPILDGLLSGTRSKEVIPFSSTVQHPLVNQTVPLYQLGNELRARKMHVLDVFPDLMQPDNYTPDNIPFTNPLLENYVRIQVKKQERMSEVCVLSGEYRDLEQEHSTDHKKLSSIDSLVENTKYLKAFWSQKNQERQEREEREREEQLEQQRENEEDDEIFENEDQAEKRPPQLRPVTPLPKEEENRVISSSLVYPSSLPDYQRPTVVDPNDPRLQRPTQFTFFPSMDRYLNEPQLQQTSVLFPTMEQIETIKVNPVFNFVKAQPLPQSHLSLQPVVPPSTAAPAIAAMPTKYVTTSVLTASAGQKESLLERLDRERMEKEKLEGKDGKTDSKKKKSRVTFLPREEEFRNVRAADRRQKVLDAFKNAAQKSIQTERSVRQRMKLNTDYNSIVKEWELSFGRNILSFISLDFLSKRRRIIPKNEIEIVHKERNVEVPNLRLCVHIVDGANIPVRVRINDESRHEDEGRAVRSRLNFISQVTDNIARGKQDSNVVVEVKFKGRTRVTSPAKAPFPTWNSKMYFDFGMFGDRLEAENEEQENEDYLAESATNKRAPWLRKAQGRPTTPTKPGGIVIREAQMAKGPAEEVRPYTNQDIAEMDDLVQIRLFSVEKYSSTQNAVKPDVVSVRIDKLLIGELVFSISALFMNQGILSGSYRVDVPPSLASFRTIPVQMSGPSVPYETVNPDGSVNIPPTINIHVSFLPFVSPLSQYPELDDPTLPKNDTNENPVTLDMLETKRVAYLDKRERAYRNLQMKGMTLEGNDSLITRFMRKQNPPKFMTDPNEIFHYVSLFPFSQDQDVFGDRSDGDASEHAFLLNNYFLTLGLESFTVFGVSIPDGRTIWVVTLERDEKKKVKRVKLWNASSHQSFLGKDPSCPLRRVGMAASPTNIYLNMHNDEYPWLMDWDIPNSSKWSSVWNEKADHVQMELKDSVQKEYLEYQSTPQRYVIELKNDITACVLRELEIEMNVKGRELRVNRAFRDVLHQVLRRLEGSRMQHYWTAKITKAGDSPQQTARTGRTQDDDEVSENDSQNQIVDSEIGDLEEDHEDEMTLEDCRDFLQAEHDEMIRPITDSYTMNGITLNFPYVSLIDVAKRIKNCQLTAVTASTTEFAFDVFIAPYPNYVTSVWVYVASLAPLPI
ncbi:putative coiled-coil and C2 domain-containing protein 2A [Blattamonas nauphoetae]|uniref:Coiled-coil and C2 domain-containing protein 2A n=1 Tax=Blattamonas nauphoetae TaxID=2049346 RepID=A0ABQ9YFN3_9EUKA|nr:putative coiled-coil and C2 domain-containing protein 2A [Blattamonas nauphoetae]